MLSQKQNKVHKAKSNLRLWTDSVDRFYEAYDLSLHQAMSPVRNINNELLGGNKSDQFDPRNIIALGIDHNNEKILKSKIKASGVN